METISDDDQRFLSVCPPFHLPSQQPQVNHALQVPLVPLGDLGPPLGQALLIFPEHKQVNYTITDMKHKEGEILRNRTNSHV